MQPLLRISTVPLTIEYTTKRATLQPSSEPAPRPVMRPRGLSVQASAPRIQYTPARIPQQAQPAPEALQQQQRAPAPAAAVGTGKNGETPDDMTGVVLPVDNLDVLKGPAVQPAPTYAPAQVTERAAQAQATPVNYHMDKTTFDWNVNSRPQLEFVPASLEFSVLQYNDVVIEYIGDPIYVPPSANPDYVPPPGQEA